MKKLDQKWTKIRVKIVSNDTQWNSNRVPITPKKISSNFYMDLDLSWRRCVRMLANQMQARIEGQKAEATVDLSLLLIIPLHHTDCLFISSCLGCHCHLLVHREWDFHPQSTPKEFAIQFFIDSSLFSEVPPSITYALH